MPVNVYPRTNADKWSAITTNKTDIPKADKTEFMFIARGAPTHSDVTTTDKGGKKGRMALEIFGKNLYMYNIRKW